MSILGDYSLSGQNRQPPGADEVQMVIEDLVARLAGRIKRRAEDPIGAVLEDALFLASPEGASMAADFTPVVGGVKGTVEELAAGNLGWAALNAVSVPVDLMSAGFGGTMMRSLPDMLRALPNPKALDKARRATPKANLSLSPSSNRLLKKAEHRSLNAFAERHNMTAGEKRDLINRAVRYRRTYTPELGFQEMDFDWKRDPNTGAYSFSPKVTKGQTGFTYSRGEDLQPLRGSARVSEVDRMSNALAREIDAISKSGTAEGLEVNKARRWYKNVRDKIRQAYGGMGDMYGEFQAAGSPNTGLKINFEQSDDYFRRYLAGDFDDQLRMANEHLAQGGTYANMPEEFIPKKRNGGKYGMHGKRMLQVIQDDFRQIAPGMAPKMRNYGQNLIGAGTDPTIDVWAARILQRMAGKPIPAPIMSSVPGTWTGTGVEDLEWQLGRRRSGVPTQRFGEEGEGWVEPLSTAKGGGLYDISEEYGMGDEVFKAATRKLREMDPARYGDLDPSDLQAMAWLHEKTLWENKGWTDVAEEAHLEDLIASGTGRGRMQAGVSPTRKGDPTQSEFYRGVEMLEEGLPNTAVDATRGLYMGDEELAFDMEMIGLEGKGQFETNVGKVGQEFDQWDVFTSVVNPVDDVNVRPGMEVYWPPGNTVEQDVIGMAYENDIPGLTMVTDKRGNTVGVRTQFVPEFNDPAQLQSFIENPQMLEEQMRAFEQNVDRFTHEAGLLPNVSYAEPTAYQTQARSRSLYPTGQDTQYLWQPGALPQETMEEALRRTLWEKAGVLGMPAIKY
jgi:hypothetical protein